MMDGLTTLSAKERNPNQNKDTTRIRWPLPPSASVGGGCPASSSAILQHLRHRAAPPPTAPLERQKKKGERRCAPPRSITLGPANTRTQNSHVLLIAGGR